MLRQQGQPVLRSHPGEFSKAFRPECIEIIRLVLRRYDFFRVAPYIESIDSPEAVRTDRAGIAIGENNIVFYRYFIVLYGKDTLIETGIKFKSE